MVTTARQKVLAYLKKNRAVSAAQIGRALKMSAANVRHHLSVLCSDGRAVLIAETRKSGRGRPVKVYGLSESLLGNNLALLSDLMLTEWLGKLSPAKRADAIADMAKGLVNQLGRINSNVPMAKRLALLIEKLNALYYQARWEAGAEGPRVLFAHCPYARIIDKHPELCLMDTALLEELTGQSVEQTMKMEKGGGSVCVFRLEGNYSTIKK
ncbi:MAG: ArsR family transcriptional regulator [Anaerolineales bacterium]|nr:ArsR family transcriptional regulator [Anaerolineales bacterium]